jgi:hypothetical protein
VGDLLLVVELAIFQQELGLPEDLNPTAEQLYPFFKGWSALG